MVKEAAGTAFVLGVVFWIAMGMAMMILAALVACLVVVVMLVAGISMLANDEGDDKLTGAGLVVASLLIGGCIVAAVLEPSESERKDRSWAKACDLGHDGDARVTVRLTPGEMQVITPSRTDVLVKSIAYHVRSGSSRDTASREYPPEEVFWNVVLPFETEFDVLSADDRCVSVELGDTDPGPPAIGPITCEILIDGELVERETSSPNALGCDTYNPAS